MTEDLTCDISLACSKLEDSDISMIPDTSMLHEASCEPSGGSESVPDFLEKMCDVMDHGG